jgi:hypothetical protein
VTAPTCEFAKGAMIVSIHPAVASQSSSVNTTISRELCTTPTLRAIDSPLTSLRTYFTPAAAATSRVCVVDEAESMTSTSTSAGVTARMDARAAASIWARSRVQTTTLTSAGVGTNVGVPETGIAIAASTAFGWRRG